jgi:hypothetical protein
MTLNQLVKGPLLKSIIIATVSKAAIVTAYFSPNSRRAAKMGISQNWKYLPRANEGMAKPEKVGYRLITIATKTIINAIALDFIGPIHLVIANLTIYD